MLGMTAAMQNALSFAVEHGSISIDDPAWDGLRVRALWRRGLLRPTRFYFGPLIDERGYCVSNVFPIGVFVMDRPDRVVAEQFEPTAAGYATMLLLEAPEIPRVM